MILSLCRHGVSSSRGRSYVNYDLLTPRKRLLSWTGRFDSDATKSAAQRLPARSKRIAYKHDGSITELPDEAPTQVGQHPQTPDEFHGDAPNLPSLTHQLELSNPSDVLCRRFFGPFALIRSRAINSRMESNHQVQSNLKHQAAKEKSDLARPLEDTEKDRAEAARLAMRCARDLLLGQFRGAVEPGDLERIIGVARNNAALTWTLASPQLATRMMDSSIGLERTARLRLCRIYTAFLQRENGSVHWSVVWQSLLTSAKTLNTNAMAHYLRLWREDLQKSSKVHSPFKINDFLQALLDGMKHFPSRAGTDNKALMTLLCGPTMAPPVSTSTSDTSIRALLWRADTPPHVLPYDTYIKILQSLGALSILKDEYAAWWSSSASSAAQTADESQSLTTTDQPEPAPLSSTWQRDTPAHFMRAFFALNDAPFAWEVFHATGFTAGEGNRKFDTLLLSHRESRPDFLSSPLSSSSSSSKTTDSKPKEWPLTPGSKATLSRRLSAQVAIYEEMQCEHLQDELRSIEDVLRVKWVPTSTEEGVAPGYHVFDESSIVEEEEEEDRFVEKEEEEVDDAESQRKRKKRRRGGIRDGGGQGKMSMSKEMSKSKKKSTEREVRGGGGIQDSGHDGW